MTVTIREATQQDVTTIVDFLEVMQDELQALAFDKQAFTNSVSQSLKENVVWFLFIDEKGETFGTCHLQSLHNYWRMERRFYCGGFYIKMTHRGRGHFREINDLLKDWATEHDGVEIYGHIHNKNEKSLQTFKTAGFNDIGYSLCVRYWGENAETAFHLASST
ncbi:MAG: GNAT family N-acetyltransferase [Alphaproteobacteria bacterium]|nr:GNAT family N-acetyltransferase [Alphaproteobacteria bacterium]